jgi:hypothetical protein
MDIRVTVGGVEAVVTVRDAAEAASLLSQLAAVKTQPAPSNTVADNPQERTRSVNLDTYLDDHPYAESNVRNALMAMKGKPVSKFLAALLNYPSGATDTVLKEALNLGEDQHLGPQVSNVSKACKKYSLDKEAIVLSQSKRLSDGSMKYRFKLTDQAARLIRSIDKFSEVVDFDEAMT